MMVAMQIRMFASGQWLLDETGSAAQLGYLGAIQLLQMPVVIYGGALADTMDRKKLMGLTQIVSFGSLALLALAAFTGTLAPWHVFVATGVTGIVNMLGTSARPAMISRVVPKTHITHAVTINTATFQVAGIAAPLIFGGLYTFAGPGPTFAAAAAIAVLSVVCPLLIRVSGAPDGGSRRVTLQSLKEGFSFVKNHKLLPGLYMLDIGVTVVSFYRFLFPVFARDLYGMGAGAAGALGAANSLGGVLGSMLVLYTAKAPRKGLLVLVATLIYALLLFAFGMNPFFWVGLVIVAGLGMMDAIGMTMRQAIVQLTTPDALLGRASSAHSFSAMGANHVGQMEVAFVSAAVGAGPAMVIGGFVSVVVVAVIWRGVRSIREYRYPG